MSNRALIFGANGQDGRLLSRQLINAGHEVFAWVRDPSRPLINDLDKIKNYIDQKLPDKIFYFSAVHNSATNMKQNSKHFIETKQVHTDIPTEIINHLWLNSYPTRFAYANSCLIYQGTQNDKINENAARNFESEYSLTKSLAADMIEYFYKQGALVYDFRLFNHESAYRRHDFFIPKLIWVALKAKQNPNTIEKFGNLNFRADWGCANEYMHLLNDMLDHTEPGCYNICTGRSLTGRAVAKYVFECLGLNYSQHIVTGAVLTDRKNLSRIGDNSKILECYGRIPIRPIEEVIGDMINWCQRKT